VEELTADAERELGWLLDFGQVRGLLREHLEGRRNHTRRLTCLASFFLWNRLARPSWDALRENAMENSYNPGKP
jgi:hypothetical protein